MDPKPETVNPMQSLSPNPPKPRTLNPDEGNGEMTEDPLGT